MSDDNAQKKLLSDSAFVLAVIVAVLYFLGAQREFGYIHSYNRGGGFRSMPDLQYLVIMGFNVITSLGVDWFEEYWFGGCIKYVIRGIIAAAIALMVSLDDSKAQTLRQSFLFWLGCMACLWGLSAAAINVGQSERKAREGSVVLTLTLKEPSSHHSLKDFHPDDSNDLKTCGGAQVITGFFDSYISDGYMILSKQKPGTSVFIPRAEVAAAKFTKLPPKPPEASGESKPKSAQYLAKEKAENRRRYYPLFGLAVTIGVAYAIKQGTDGFLRWKIRRQFER